MFQQKRLKVLCLWVVLMHLFLGHHDETALVLCLDQDGQVYLETQCNGQEHDMLTDEDASISQKSCRDIALDPFHSELYVQQQNPSCVPPTVSVFYAAIYYGLDAVSAQLF